MGPVGRTLGEKESGPIMSLVGCPLAWTAWIAGLVHPARSISVLPFRALACAVLPSRPPATGATFGDRAWVDQNGNGVQDPSELGLPGVTVQLLGCDGTVLRSTTTDASGRYSFAGLPAGSYRLAFAAPAGSTFVISTAGQGGNAALDSDIDASGRTACISVGPGESRTDIDAGFTPGVCWLQDRLRGLGGWFCRWRCRTCNSALWG